MGRMKRKKYTQNNIPKKWRDPARLAKKSCSHKIGYKTADEAETEAERLSVLDNEPMTTYLCEVCNKYHVTHRKHKRKDI